MVNHGCGILAGIVIGDVAGIRRLPGHGAYCASEVAVISNCESLRGELRTSGVTLGLRYIGMLLTQQNRYAMPFLMSASAFASQAFLAIQAVSSYRVIPW